MAETDWKAEIMRDSPTLEEFWARFIKENPGWEVRRAEMEALYAELAASIKAAAMEKQTS